MLSDRHTEPRNRFVVVLQEAGYTTIGFRERVIVRCVADHGVTEWFMLNSHVHEVRLEKVTAVTLQRVMVV